MSKEDINIVYTCILKEKHTILSEYTECSGNFSQIMEHIMKEIILKFENPPTSYRTYFYIGKYTIFLIKYKKLYIIIMFPVVNINNKEIIFTLLFSLYDKLKSKKEINVDNVSKIRGYTLDFSSVFKEKIKDFYSNSNSFISLLKYSNDFILYEPFENRYFEKDVQFPILSKIQVHAEKKKNNDEISKEETEISFRKSYNSIYTQDSFKDDILKQDKNQKLIEDDNPINLINEKDIDEKNIILKEKSRGAEKSNKKSKIILIIVIVLVLAAISLGVYFSLK